MKNPGDELAKATAQLADRAARLDATPLLHQAREAARRVQQVALNHGSRVGIRVMARHGGVRVTLVGRDAAKYRTLMSNELHRVSPSMANEVRAQITRKP